MSAATLDLTDAQMTEAIRYRGLRQLYPRAKRLRRRCGACRQRCLMDVDGVDLACTWCGGWWADLLRPPTAAEAQAAYDAAVPEPLTPEQLDKIVRYVLRRDEGKEGGRK